MVFIIVSPVLRWLQGSPALRFSCRRPRPRMGEPGILAIFDGLWQEIGRAQRLTLR